MSMKYQGTLEFRHLEYGHRKSDPTRGVDYVLSLSFKNKSNGQVVSKK